MSSIEFNADKITKCALIDYPAGDKILGGDLSSLGILKVLIPCLLAYGLTTEKSCVILSSCFVCYLTYVTCKTHFIS